MSSALWSATILSASAVTASPSPASSTCASLRTCDARSAAVASTPTLSRSAHITVAPSAASASADALPMPDAAPSTSAVLPSSRNRLRTASRRCATIAIVSVIASRSAGAALLGHGAELLHIVLARIGGDALVRRVHHGAERREIGLRDLYACRRDLLDLVRFLVGDHLAHQVTSRDAFLAEDLLLLGRELLPRGGAHGVDHVVVDVARDREVLLHLVELVEVDHGDRVLLAVDHLLRQREVELGERDRLDDAADRLERGLDLQLGRRAQLEALDVGWRVDRAHFVGHFAKAVPPVAQRDDALPRALRREPIHRRPVEHPEGVLR